MTCDSLFSSCRPFPHGERATGGDPEGPVGDGARRCRTPRRATLLFLLGATALAGAAFSWRAAHADPAIVFGGKPATADDGSDGFGDTSGDNGQNGPNILPQPTINATDRTSFGTPAVFGDARGGDGGDGGTAVSVDCHPFPLCTPSLEGGDGGDGGKGGVVDVSNTAHLDATGSNGLAADASGGRGGDGGWAAALDASDGGDGGKGGDGGSAKAVADVTSVITTHDGDGIYVVSDGGRGGDGGNGGAIVVGSGGYGGQGGAGCCHGVWPPSPDCAVRRSGTSMPARATSPTTMTAGLRTPMRAASWTIALRELCVVR